MLNNNNISCAKFVTPSGDTEIYIIRKKKEKKPVLSLVKKEDKEEKIYFAKQKGVGVILLLLSVLIPFVTGGDITVSLFLFPLGVFLICTKEKCMYW